MCFISVPNLKEIYPGNKCCLWLKVIVVNQCKEEEGKCEENWASFRNTYFKNTQLISFKFGMQVVYMEDMQYVNFIEIGVVVIEI